jgi:hypothetical protein
LETILSISDGQDTVTLQSLDIALDMNAVYEDTALTNDEVENDWKFNI